MTREIRDKAQAVVDECPGFNGRAMKGLMEFVYKADLSLSDYEEIANMITMRMYQYAEQEVARSQQVRKMRAERIATVGI